MSHESEIEILRQAKALGYFNILFFVATESATLNIARVRQRVELGGHDVSAGRISAGYERALNLLPEAILECDRVVLFDNSYRARPGEPVRLVPFAEILRKDGELISQPKRGPLPDWFKPAFLNLLPSLR